tara:strand:+ start:58 stop:495 length:438 start_codon:yes stop_codon:yes gene_type:complete
MPETSGTATAGRTRRARPVYTNLGLSDLMQYRLPLAGILSILHRASGALLFLVGIPLALYLLQLSLSSAEGYAAFESLASGFFIKLVLLVLIWAFMHHLCAGIRYLIIDLHVGVEKEQAHFSAKVAFGVSAVLTLIAGAKLFGAF